MAALEYLEMKEGACRKGGGSHVISRAAKKKICGLEGRVLAQSIGSSRKGLWKRGTLAFPEFYRAVTGGRGVEVMALRKSHGGVGCFVRRGGEYPKKGRSGRMS